MPSVYRVVFSDDTAPAELDPAIAGAVTTDGGKRGRIVPGEYQALLVGEKIVPLPHPAEQQTIREHGESFVSASFKGTYLRVTQRLCMQCGTLIEAPQISFGAPGCLPSVLAGAGAGIYAVLAAKWELFDGAQLALGTLCGSLLFTTLSGLAYAKLRWRNRQRLIARNACPVCRSKILRSITSLAGQTVQLNAQTREVTVEVAGRS
jgi:hypothetical protein